MKKILAVLVLVFSMVMGCGDDGDGGNEGTLLPLDGVDADAVVPDTTCPACEKCPDCPDVVCPNCPSCDDEDVTQGEDNPVFVDVPGPGPGPEDVQVEPDVVMPPVEDVVVPPAEDTLAESNPQPAPDANTDVPPVEPPLVIVPTTTLTVKISGLFVEVSGDAVEVSQFEVIQWWTAPEAQDEVNNIYYNILTMDPVNGKTEGNTLTIYFLALDNPYVYFNFYDSEGSLVLLVDETTTTPMLGPGVSYYCTTDAGCCLELDEFYEF